MANQSDENFSIELGGMDPQQKILVEIEECRDSNDYETVKRIFEHLKGHIRNDEEFVRLIFEELDAAYEANYDYGEGLNTRSFAINTNIEQRYYHHTSQENSNINRSCGPKQFLFLAMDYFFNYSVNYKTSMRLQLISMLLKEARQRHLLDQYYGSGSAEKGNPDRLNNSGNPQAPLNPFAVIRNCILKKYATFDGRASLAEFWIFHLSLLPVVFCSLIALRAVPMVGVVMLLATGFGLAIPSLAVAVRRLHDSGKPGFLVLTLLIPYLGWFVYIFLMLSAGDPKPNRYGDPVK